VSPLEVSKQDISNAVGKMCRHKLYLFVEYEDVKGRDHFGEAVIDGRVILKLIKKKRE
jgi:hypothetical protein